MVIKIKNKLGSVNRDDDVGGKLAAFFLCTDTFWYDNHGRKWDRLVKCYWWVHINTTLLEPSATKI
jgi:hypothetical protein